MSQFLLNEKGWVRSGWKALAFLAGLTGANALVYTVLVGLLGLEGLVKGPVGEVIPTLIVLAVSWAALNLENRPMADLGLRLDPRWARELALGILTGTVLIGLAATTLWALDGFTWVPNPAMRAQALLHGGWLFLFVAINEEALFRGYPFQRLVEGRLGPWGTQLLFAAFFALVHLSNPGLQTAGATLKAIATLNIALAALLLGLAYLRTRSLALPIGIHWAWNFVQGNLLGFPVSGTGERLAPLKPILKDRPDWLTGGAVGLEGSVTCTMVCLVAIVLLCFWRGSAVPAQEQAEA